MGKRARSAETKTKSPTRKAGQPDASRTVRAAHLLFTASGDDARQRLSQADGATRQRVVAQLQRTGGNRAVGIALSQPARSRAVVTRDLVVQRDKLRKTKFDRAAIELIKTNAEGRHDAITNFIGESRGTLNIYQSRLLSAAAIYKAAFNRHKAVLDEAGEAAADRRQMISTLAGFALGVAMGPGGAFLKLTGRAALALHIGGEMLEIAVGAGAGALSGAPDRKEFEPTAEIPELRELAVWKSLAEVRDRLLGVAMLTAKQMKISSVAGSAIAEIRLREGGAKNLEMTDAQLTALVAGLKEADEASGEVASGLRAAKAEIDALGATPAQSKSVDEVEQNIWIEWIADLTNDDLLDEDDITDHLESLGVIGEGRRVWDEDDGWRREPPRLDVDFGHWVSDDDEEEAVALARASLGRHAASREEEGTYDPDYE